MVVFQNILQQMALKEVSMEELSELSIEGVLCEKCGVYIGEPCFYTRKCDVCMKASVDGNNSEEEPVAVEVEGLLVRSFR